MVRRYRKRARRGRSRRRVPRKTRTIARKALRIARKLAATRETKHIDQSNVSQYPGRQITDLKVYPLQQITIGTNDLGQRIGDSINPLSMFIRFTARMRYKIDLGNTAYQANQIRFWVVRFHRPNSNDPDSDILQLFNSNNTDHLAPISFKQWDWRHGYHIIYNKVFTLDSFHPSKVFYHRFKLGFKTQYDDQTNRVNTNNLYFGWQYDQAKAVADGDQPLIDYAYRITYADA